MTQAGQDFARAMLARGADGAPAYGIDDVLSVIPSLLSNDGVDANDPTVRELTTLFCAHTGISLQTPKNELAAKIEAWMSHHPPSSSLMKELEHYARSARIEGGGVAHAAAALLGAERHLPPTKKGVGNLIDVLAAQSARKGSQK